MVFLKDNIHFKFCCSAFGGPLTQYCNIPNALLHLSNIPLFQHSNWGEAPSVYQWTLTKDILL
jgi:hypothetical protein